VLDANVVQLRHAASIGNGCEEAGRKLGREIAVCNLGSVNLANHVTESGIDEIRLKKTVTTAMRMLDNVIDINFYTVPEAGTPTCAIDPSE
jgi:ribonucleotide reductase alpha subunit